jgi:RNA polymerase sigma factor (TIGR02999 family)
MILTDHARGNIAQKRGGGAQHIPLNEQIPWIRIGSESLIDLNRALDDLNAIDPYKVQLVELRYFLGCTAEETAALMQVSKATVDRDLKFIRSWLYRRVYPDAVPDIAEHSPKT